MTEQDLKKDIKTYCGLIPDCFLFPVTQKAVKGRKMQMRGIHDQIICYKGAFISVESKVGRFKMSTEQIEFKDNVEKAGGHVIVPYSLREFRDEFNKIRKVIDAK